MRQIESLDLSVPDELPIGKHADNIIDLLRSRRTLVVSGETGSGKSTQLPKLCLAAGLGRTGMVGHTQPRRLAARSIASRLADELKSAVGNTVGFKIRFTDQTKDATLVKLMTDGILLAETQRDQDLQAYDAIIVDEAHERSLNIDFLLGYLKRLRDRRPELRIIITSATIDADRFAEHFTDTEGPAPIVTVEGRTFPVEVRYRDWEEVAGVDDDGLPRQYDLSRHVAAGIDEVSQSGDGDVLVFLPTERDIREVSHYYSGHLRRRGQTGRAELLPLYARLPQSEQNKIFNPRGGPRRIVFATNVAESSLTVPGIRYVVDSGTARISRYSPRSKVQRLPIESISQASARQRAGRCGRVAPGICVRLYSEQDFDSRDAFTTPEIRRTNLASVILQTKVLRLGPIDKFPFLDPPRPETVREGYRTLFEIGALDDRRRLTPVGKKLGRLPVDPRVARVILAAERNGVLPEVLVIAAALEIQDPRERPRDKQQAADEAQAMFQDPASDFLSYLRLWKFFQQQRENLSRNRLQKACRSRFLSPNRMREWSDVYRQLREMAMTIGGRGKKHKIGQPRIEVDWDQPLSPIVDDARYSAIHQSLLTGLLSGVALRGDSNEYTGAGGLKLFLWPGSGVFESRPKWIMAAELLETSKQYARCVARIQPAWLEKIGAHLVKHNYSDPRWSTKRGSAICNERVSLFGLPVVAARSVPLPPIDPATARDLMIEHGLIESNMPTRARCIQHNRKLQAAMTDLANKSRQRDLIVDGFTILHFYHERLPSEVVDRASLEKWDRDIAAPSWTQKLGDTNRLTKWLDDQFVPDSVEPNTPYMLPEDLLRGPAATVSSAQFPDALQVGQTRLPLEYRFSPGDTDDGIKVTVPLAAVSQVSDGRLGWLVPGMTHEKVVSLIKALPKRIRRNLVPAADTAQRVCTQLAEHHGQIPFMPAVCELLSRIGEMPITESDFDRDKLPQHLQFFVNVVDDQGKSLATGRSLQDVRKALHLDDESSSEESGLDGSTPDADIDRDGLTTFDLDELPKEVVRRRGGVQVAQFPALVDLGESVSIRLFSHLGAAELATRQGLMRLFAIAERKEIRSQIRWLPDLERSRVLMAHALPPKEFESQLMDLLARRAFVDGESLVRTKQQFDARRQERGRRIAVATQEIATWLPRLAESIHQCRADIETLRGNATLEAKQDVESQIGRLLQPDFMRTTQWQWLEQYPRYFEAIHYRLDKLRSGASSRDQDCMQTIHGIWSQYEEALENDQLDQSNVQEARWMIEELRVSFFAQPLGTAVKVSPQRVEKLLTPKR